MEKGRRENGVLAHVAELFDLPADVIAGLPHLEMIGGRQLFLEQHKGLLAYSDTAIDINTGVAVITSGGSQNMSVSLDGTYDIYFDLENSTVYVMSEGRTPEE